MQITREPMDEACRAELEAVATGPTGDLPSRAVLYGAYLLQGDGDARCLFLVSGTLDQAPGLVPGEAFPGSLVRVRRLPHSGRIVDRAVEGDPVPPASREPWSARFDSGLVRECEILPAP
jgi:hypothetical protein